MLIISKQQHNFRNARDFQEFLTGKPRVDSCHKFNNQWCTIFVSLFFCDCILLDFLLIFSLNLKNYIRRRHLNEMGNSSVEKIWPNDFSVFAISLWETNHNEPKKNTKLKVCLKYLLMKKKEQVEAKEALMETDFGEIFMILVKMLWFWIFFKKLENTDLVICLACKVH